MKIIKIPLSSIYWKHYYILFNQSIKLYIEKRMDGIYQSLSIDNYPTAQYINFNSKELEIGYI